MKLLFENWRKYLKETNLTWSPGNWSPADQPAPAGPAGVSLEEYFDNKGFFLDQYLGGGAHGNVFEITNKHTGEKLAAKIVSKDFSDLTSTANPAREHSNYLFVKDNRESFGPYSKYLPVVYDSELVNMENDRVDRYGTPANTAIIIMEKLRPAPRDVLRQFVVSGKREDFTERDKRMFKNPSILTSILRDTINTNPIKLLLDDSERKAVVSKALERYYKREKEINLDLFETKYAVSAQQLANLDKILTIEAKKLLLLLFESVEAAINSSYDDKLQGAGFGASAFTVAQMIGVLHTIPDFFIREYRKPMMTGGIRISSQSMLSGRDRPSAQGAEVEREFPETIGLRNAMQAFHNAGITPKDVHIENIMMRPSTNEFVIVDLGLFKLNNVRNLSA